MLVSCQIPKQCFPNFNHDYNLPLLPLIFSLCEDFDNVFIVNLSCREALCGYFLDSGCCFDLSYYNVRYCDIVGQPVTLWLHVLLTHTFGLNRDKQLQCIVMKCSILYDSSEKYR